MKEWGSWRVRTERKGNWDNKGKKVEDAEKNRWGAGEKEDWGRVSKETRREEK